MKKTLSLVLAGLLTAALAVSASAGFTDYTELAKFGVKGIAADVAWTADGEWTEGEYAEIALKDGWISAAVNDDANMDAALELDIKMGMSWDKDYLYTYLQFEDANGHENLWAADPASMWYSGAIQVSASEVGSSGQSGIEYGIGLTSDTEEQITNIWFNELGSYDAPASDFICVVDGDIITYEYRTPFSAFSTVAAKEGAEYSYNYVISWGNAQDYIHTQLASGCTGNGKTSENFADITLEEAIVVETEPETVAEEVSAEAPATFDAGIIAAVAAIVSAAGYAISKKR